MDHSRVNISQSSMSCGVLELSSWKTDDYDGVFYQIASRLYHPARGEPAAFICWSDLAQPSPIVDYIVTRRLGNTMCSSVAENPKTGNQIVVYVWCLNHIEFKRWYSAQRLKKIQKVGT